MGNSMEEILSSGAYYANADGCAKLGKLSDRRSSRKIITLDPGMAFGTGTHPTTSLTLTALETVLRGGETLLDVGTGSGVLSIAAKYLGAKDVYAFDLDEVAVRSAKENMDMNEVAKDVHVSANDLLKGIEIESDVIVANILANIILLMIPDVAFTKTNRDIDRFRNH